MNTQATAHDSALSIQNPGFNPGHAFSNKHVLNAEESEYTLIIDPRALDRECLSQGLSKHKPEMRILTAGSVDEWRKRHLEEDPAAVLIVFSGKKLTDASNYEEIENAVETFKPSPVIMIADSDDLGDILKAIEAGARGYIPNSVNVSVAAEAIALALAGGVFIPASSILAAKEMISSAVTGSNYPSNMFTPRELQVAEALRRGKANKIIAYEMSLCESTVKVHIRNIMKKLNATNRTEVAVKLK